MDKFFYFIYQKLTKNRLCTIIFFLGCVGMISFLAYKISFEEDITKLIPTNSKTAEFQKVLKTVNFTDKIIINIHRSKSASIDDLIQYATLFIDSIKSSSPIYIKNIQGKVEDGDIQATMDFVYNNLPVFLEREDFGNILNKINQDSIQKITEANYKALLSPSGIVMKRTLLKDPLGISFIALKKLQQLGLGDDFKLVGEFLVSKDEENILLFITTKFESSETSQNGKFANKLYRLQENLNSRFSGKVKSELFGAALIAVANAKQIKNDIQFTIGIALILLILILIFFYRKIYIPLILFVPTLVGALMAVAFLYLFRGQISAISLGIGSVLLGVTLDYSLHILTHIRNNESIKNLYSDVAEPILMSSLTTALAFLCLLFLDAQALQDLGIFAAISVMGASIFALLFIPLVYKNPTEREVKYTFLDKLAAYDFHKNKWILMGISLVLIVSVFTYHNVKFNKDISKLNYEPEAIVDALKNLEKLTDISSKSIYLATYAQSTEEALQLNDSIYHKLEKLKTEGRIAGFSSIGALVQSKKEQRKKIKTWQSFWDAKTIDSLQGYLTESGKQFGFKPDAFSPFYSLLQQDFEPINPEGYQMLPSIILEDYITTKADFTTITSLIKLKSTQAGDIKTMFNDFPKTLTIDRQEMNETFLGNLKNDFNHLIGYCLIAVLFILYLFFRSFSLTLVTIMPIFLTWFMTIGTMGLLDIHFNIFNIIISTFIFGLGIDYSIFITKAMLKELQTGEQAILTHKTSIILSVITTVLGVGVLIFAKHPALYSISVVSIIGISSAVLMAFTVQPLLFNLFIGSSKRRPVTFRMFIHSVISFGYFGLGGILLSLYSMGLMKIIPLGKKAKMVGFHKLISAYMKSVLYTNPFVKKKVINESGEDFSRPAVIIANHTSFLDILAIGMLTPKICFLVNDWVYNSPVFGKAVQRADFYPVSSGIDNSLDHLRKKVSQGYSLMAFPEGTRSQSNKIKRFHKGAFFLAEKLDLDILPVLIHGNSEVLPKGSFVIKDGSLTVKILPRIKIEEDKFGNNYVQRGKMIAGYFKEEFLKLRREREDNSYFKRVLLEEFRYKGNSLHTAIKSDFKQNKELYNFLLEQLSSAATIFNISDNAVPLDFLMHLDSPDRKIISYVENNYHRKILKNSFLTHQSNKIHFVDSIHEGLGFNAEILILENSVIPESISENIQKGAFNTIVLLRDAVGIKAENILTLVYTSEIENTNLVIFRKNGIV